MAKVPWVVDRSLRSRMAAARQAKKFAMRLSGDRAAGIEDTGHNRRVDFRNVALKNGAAIHHRNASQTNAVLERDPFTGQLTSALAVDPHFDMHKRCIYFLLPPGDSRASAGI